MPSANAREGSAASSQAACAHWLLGLQGGAEWVPPTRGYSLTECLQDLLACAAKHLRVGGRLVYFLPAAPETCQGANVPQHPALRFVSNCEQVRPAQPVWALQ